MIVHPPVEAVSLITGQLLPDTMRDDTQLPLRSSRVCLFNAIDRFDASKKKKKEKLSRHDLFTSIEHNLR